MYFSLLSDMGLATVAVREGAQSRSKLQQVISSTMGLRLALAMALIPIGLVTAHFLPYSENSKDLFRIYLLTLPIQALSVEWVFRSLQKMYLNTAVQIIVAALILVLTIALVHQARDLMWVAGIAAITAAIGSFLGLWLLQRLGYHSWPVFSLRESNYLLRQSLPICAVSIASLLYVQTNNLILGVWRSEAEVGLYVAASRLSALFYYPIWYYFTAMIPALMEAWAVSLESARSLISSSVRITAMVGIGTGLVASSLGEWAIRTVFGRSFDGAASAFNILIWTGVIVAIGHNWGELCIASRRNRLLMGATFLGVFVNFAVCAATISRMGIRGAALGNLMAEIVSHVFLIASFDRYMGVTVLRGALKPVLAGAGAYAISFATRGSSPFIRAALTGGAFLLLLVLTGALTKLDVNRLRALLPMRRNVAESLS
jgi:PST family polysaccharide transporter